MKKSHILAKAISTVLTGATLTAISAGVHAQNTTYVGNLTSTTYTSSDSTPIFAWDGHNNTTGGLGWGWGHNADFLVFNLVAPTALDIKMTSTTGGTAQANFNAGLTLWSTAGYHDPSPIGNGHTFSQVSTDSTAGGGTLPWLTDPAAGNVTGFIGYANAGPAGWINAASKTVGSGTELNGIGFVNTVTVGSHNAELRTTVLPAGQYLMAVGGSYACGSFLSNVLSTCPTGGSGAYNLTLTLPIRDDNDADGKADVLWRNSSTGDNALFFMNGAAATIALAPTVADLNWKIKGRGDYNGDGKADILWRNSTSGATYLYLMDGATTSAPSPPSGFIAAAAALTTDIKGSGDFNGDGKDDILWSDGSGNVSVDLMNGTSILSTILSGNLTSGVIKGAGDYNGDGKADILWSNSSNGDLKVNLTTGTTLASASLIFPTVPSGWDVKASGDYNGDGKDDIFLYNGSAGASYELQMNGSAILAQGFVDNYSLSPGWEVKGSGDYNGDGRNDIFWHHNTGVNYIYLMNGFTFTPVYVNTISDLNWQISYTQ